MIDETLGDVHALRQHCKVVALAIVRLVDDDDRRRVKLRRRFRRRGVLRHVFDVQRLRQFAEKERLLFAAQTGLFHLAEDSLAFGLIDMTVGFRCGDHRGQNSDAQLALLLRGRGVGAETRPGRRLAALHVLQEIADAGQVLENAATVFGTP
ncbi:hypothetical protein HC891_14480, partial [Candidatus Gracilibacteria bacterium]|nr:hypothetical protein [Candidatus Gracilibacteria bacterium]